MGLLLAGLGLLLAPSVPAADDLPGQNEEVATLYAEGLYSEGVELARRYLAAWEDSLGADSPEACSMAANLGPLLTMAGDLEAAEEAHRHAIECLGDHFGPESEDLASALNNYGSHLGFAADFGRAEVALAESLRLLRLNLGDDHYYVAITLNNLGINQQNQGNPVAAERTMREAVDRLRTSLGPDHPITATAVNNLGRLLVARGEFAEARPLLGEALAVRDSVLGSAHQETANGRRDLGRLLHRQGHLADAEAELRRALADFSSALGADHPDVAMTRHDLGRVLVSEGRLAEARSELLAALDLFAAHYDEGHSSLVQLQRELGELDVKEGDWPSASRRFLTAARSFELGRGRTGEGLSRATYLDSPWRLVAAARLHEGDGDGAWAAYNRSLGRVLAEELFPGTEPAGDWPPETAAIGWLDVDMGDGLRAWAWSLREGRVRWHPLADPSGHGRLVSALREALGSPGPRGRLEELARQVWEMRVKPLQADLQGVKHLVVIPAGAMLGVPLGSLKDSQGRWLADRWTLSAAPSPAVYAWLQQQPARQPGQALFLGDPHLPSAGLQVAESRRPSDAVIRGAAHGLSEDLEGLPPLPGTRLEVQNLAVAWPDCRVLLGAEASEDNLVHLAATGALSHFQVLHFATHALVDAEDAEASALVLSQNDLPEPLVALARGEKVLDGLVTSGEIADEWKLDADLVVLSACNSALGRPVVGEGLVGFAHVFLRKGARAVLASQWSVPDRAAQIFMSAFYEAWHGQERSRAEALAEARNQLRAHIAADGRRPYTHPYFWASFELVGDDR